MLLNYITLPDGKGSFVPVLCMVPDKFDQQTFPTIIDKLITTEASVIRVGPQEAIRVSSSSSGGVIIDPVPPAKLFLTPQWADRPGFIARKVCVNKTGETYQILFQGDADKGTNNWREWIPATMAS